MRNSIGRYTGDLNTRIVKCHANQKKKHTHTHIFAVSLNKTTKKATRIKKKQTQLLDYFCLLL